MTGIVAEGDYSVARVVGDLVFTAGMTPRRDGVMVATGVVGRDLTVREARPLAQLATARALGAARLAIGDDARIASVVSLTVFIAAAPEFTSLGSVADAASTHIRTALPEAAMPVRAAIGVVTLPDGAPVEVQLICEISR